MLRAKGTLRHPSAQMKIPVNAATGSVYIHPLQSSERCNLQQTSANPKNSELAFCDLQYLQALKNSKCCHLQYLQAPRKLNAIVAEFASSRFQIGSLCARQDAVDCITRTETMQEDQSVQRRRPTIHVTFDTFKLREDPKVQNQRQLGGSRVRSPQVL